MPGIEVEAGHAISHYESAHEVPLEIKKYWHQRHQIFSKYDEGIWMTNDSWFGVTPEPVANKIADHFTESAPRNKRILIDAFAGVGGNSIAFALSGRWDQIFAIEKDPAVLQCGKHNAEVYDVSKKIWWIQGDFFDVMKKRLFSVASEAVVFASPPWGGPNYSHEDIFSLESMQPYTFGDIYSPVAKLTGDIVFYLPRTSDLNELARYVPEDCELSVIHYCVNGYSKAICAYVGNFI